MLNDENNIVDSMSAENFKNKIEDFYRKYNGKIGFSYTPNNKLLQEQIKLRKRLQNISVFNIDLDKTYNKLHDQYKSNKLMLNDDEWDMMNIDRNINYMRMMIELLKIFNDELILYKEKNKSGNVYLLDVGYKIGYKSETQKRLLKNLFYIELRNALSHMDYYYKLNNNKKFEFVWNEKIKNLNSTITRNEHTYQIEDIKFTMYKIFIILDVQKEIFTHIMKINAYTLIKISNEGKVHLIKNRGSYI